MSPRGALDAPATCVQMGWNEAKLNRLASEYARVGYVPGPDAPTLPPDDITPDSWLVVLYLLPDGVGQRAYDVALKLADVLHARSSGRNEP